MFKKLLLQSIILLFSINAKGQTSKFDSLRNRAELEKVDTSRIKLLITLGREFKKAKQFDSALYYHEKCITISQKIKDKCWLGKSIMELARDQFVKGNFDSCYYYSDMSYQIFTKELMTNPAEMHKRMIKDGRAAGLAGRGTAMRYKGVPDKAIKEGFDYLHFGEEEKDSSIISMSYLNIARSYLMLKDFKNGKDYIHQSLRFATNATIKGQCYDDLGVMYMERNQYDSAIKYTTLGMDISKQVGNTQSYHIGLVNLASINISLGNNELKKNGLTRTALSYFHQSREEYEEAARFFRNRNDLNSLCTVLSNLGSLNTKIRKYADADRVLKEALDIAIRLNVKKELQWIHFYLFELAKQKNDQKNALMEYEMYIAYKDSIINEQTASAAVKQELKYSFDKKAAADYVAHAKESEIKNVELEKQKVEISAKKNQQYALFSGLGLVIIFAGFMYSRFKITQKQKGIIESQKQVVEEQKKIVEEKQKEVLDSIYYARKIQMALIPSEKRIEQILVRLKKV